MKKLLRVTGNGYVAAAVFAKVGDTWYVESTAPILAWMRGLDAATIRQRLADQGATWKWEECDEHYDAGLATLLKAIQGAAKNETKRAMIKKGNRR